MLTKNRKNSILITKDAVPIAGNLSDMDVHRTRPSVSVFFYLVLDKIIYL